MEGLFVDDGRLIGVVVAAVVVGLQLVGIVVEVFLGQVVVDVEFVVLVEIDFVIVVVVVFAFVVVNGWLVVVIIVLASVFECRVGLDLLFDALLEFD